MIADFDKFVEGLAGDAIEGATKKTNEQRFECGQCGGTGRYQGARVHQVKSHCFACKGTGYFKTDPRKLKQQRINAAAAKAKAQEDGIAAFRVAQPEMFQELKTVHEFGGSNEFIMSLAHQLFSRGSLSENQIAAWHRGKAKLEAIRAEKTAEREAAAVSVDLSTIEAMFATAFASGYKKPAYRANDLRIKPGKEGALYVFDERQVEFGMYGETPAYVGKIASGKFYGTRKAAEDTSPKLLAIAADPRGEAIRHGQRTGTCSCCGRELTKHASIEAGIGPICAEKWGL